MRPWIFARLLLAPRAMVYGAVKPIAQSCAGHEHSALQRLDSRARQAFCCFKKQASTRSFGTSIRHSSRDVLCDELPHKAYIALGSNLGNRIGMIERACKMMEEDRSIRISRTSSLYETEPMYVKGQGRFINGVCEINTRLGPSDLLNKLQAIENELGRVKIIDKGPRNIDLDILLYNSTVLESENLTIPHRLMLEREFVLRPLCDLIPEGRLPDKSSHTSFRNFLTRLPKTISPMYAVTALSDSLTPLYTNKKGQNTRIMSILNVTPDSFSDGGQNNPQDQSSIRKSIISQIEAGADIIDVGGQSSRPNAPSVETEEELSRVIPVIECIRSLPEAQNIPISIDTYRSSVAKAAVSSGASIVNDVSAGCLDLKMLPTVAELGCTLCLMHMRGSPTTMMHFNNYPNGIIQAVGKELLDRLDAAQRTGIKRWRVILDPGFGFAKNSQQNLELLRNFAKVRSTVGLQSIPWLSGISRKGFVGRITNVQEPKDRVWGTAAAVTAAIHGGVDIVRVHDVAEMSLVSKMADAIWKSAKP